MASMVSIGSIVSVVINKINGYPINVDNVIKVNFNVNKIIKLNFTLMSLTPFWDIPIRSPPSASHRWASRHTAPAYQEPGAAAGQSP